MGRMKNLAEGRKRRFFCVLVAVLVLTAGLTVSAGAARVFTDVGDREWYDEFVLKAYEAGLISGFEDATFKPNNSISRVEVIVCLARLAGYADDSAAGSYIQKYKTRMNADNIPVWAEGYIAYALEKGIVTEEELATFIRSDGETQNNAKRAEVAVYLSKTLGFEQEAKSYTDRVLGFVDNEIISDWHKGYIKTLYDRGIMKGDDTNRFNPNNEITRAEIATMLSTSLQYAGGIDTATTTIEGRVDEVVTGTGRTVIKIAVTDGDIDMYEVASAVTIRLNGNTASLSSISSGQQGTFGIRNDRIVSVDVVSKAGTVEGIVRDVYVGSEYRSITIRDDDGDRYSYRVMENAVIKLEGETVDLDRIHLDDRVKVTASDTYATRIEAERKTKTAMGIFGGFKTDKDLVLILIKGSQELEYPVDDDAKVERDGRSRGLEDLRRGDEIEITLEYGIVTGIEAESRDRNIEGILEALIIAKPHQLTILNDDGETETFILPVDVGIKVDGKTASVYDLRLDYILDIKVESDEIVSIKAESVAEQNEVLGTVEYVNTDVEVITIKESNTNALRQINIDADTRIVNSSGTRRYLRHIDVGDRLVVFGRSELGVFIADTIIIRD
jgi:hypothetical protein